jgi:hypothetical protein
MRADGLPIDIDIRVLQAGKLRDGRFLVFRSLIARQGEPWRASAFVVVRSCQFAFSRTASLVCRCWFGWLFGGRRWRSAGRHLACGPQKEIAGNNDEQNHNGYNDPVLRSHG